MSYSWHRSRKGDPRAAGGEGALAISQTVLLPPGAGVPLGSHREGSPTGHVLSFLSSPCLRTRPGFAPTPASLLSPGHPPPTLGTAVQPASFHRCCDENGAERPRQPPARALLSPVAVAPAGPAGLVPTSAQHRAWQPDVRGLLAEGARNRPFLGGQPHLRPRPGFVPFWLGPPLLPPAVNQAPHARVPSMAGERGLPTPAPAQ